MRTVTTILVIFLVRCVYLHPADEGTSIMLPDILSNIKKITNQDCIFAPASMSMVLYNNDNLEGKNIGVSESCDNVNTSKPIVFIVHGFISDANSTYTYELAKQMVKNNYTVFSLDWSNAACKNGIPVLKLLEYPVAVKNTREIGKLMAKYVIQLIDECKIPLDKITFVGHSLGAHVCGFAAKHIQEETSYTIVRIFGADPAAPLFATNCCDERLCKTDAINVIVLHTSILGIPYCMGRIDLWFNGGKKQPDCGLLENIPCSHSRSIEYLTDLFNNYVFPGVQNENSLTLKNVFKISKVENMVEDIFENYRGLPYPDSTTTDCIILDYKIFNVGPKDKLRKGSYYMFVNSEPPFGSRDSFSCKSLIVEQ
ncbi:phospholipase A1-like [Anoplolepis gracilipes]|uniref:phospholipase A1-like n=1 Tax=Anoplolepis gracilipes TaxID=354296 RepID=UPI003B9E6513